MTEKRYLKWYNKIGYGSGDIAGNVVYAFLPFFVMIYLTDTIGLNPGIIGTLMAVAKIFDGIYQCRSMKWNRIADCTALRFRHRQDRKGNNQNEYYGDDRNNIFLHELYLDNMSRYPLLLSILDRVTGTAEIAIKNRDQSGGMVVKPLIALLIDIR